jgi:hypothetical protein
VRGRLGVAAVRRVVVAALPALSRCYARSLAQDTTLKGRISLGWVISRKGFVLLTKVYQATLPVPAVTACLEAEIKRLQFPAPAAGMAVSELTLVLQPIKHLVAKAALVGLKVLGPLGTPAVKRPLTRRLDSLAACWQKHGRTGQFHLSLGFSITRAGQVTQALQHHSTLRNRLAERCVLVRLARTRFPSSGKGATQVTAFLRLDGR